MMFYMKELPDNTVTLLTGDGQIIGKFDSVDEAASITLEASENDEIQSELAVADYDYLQSP